MMVKVSNVTTSQISLPFVGAVGAPTGSNTSTLPVGATYTYEVAQHLFDQTIAQLDAMKTKSYITYVVVDDTTVPDKGEMETKGQIFVSALTAGTGAPQNVAHGLGVVPSKVIVSQYDGVLSVAEGTHTATNVVCTVTNGAHFKVWAAV